MLFLAGSILISNIEHRIVNSYSSNYGGRGDASRGSISPRMFMHARSQKENHGRHFSNRIGRKVRGGEGEGGRLN